MPKGVPDRCNKPTTSPLQTGWSSNATTTTTTPAPVVSSGIFVPPSGDICIGSEIFTTTTLPPESDFTCEAYKVTTRAANLYDAVVEFTNCQTLEKFNLSFAPKTCTIVYSATYPNVLDDGSRPPRWKPDNDCCPEDEEDPDTPDNPECPDCGVDINVAGCRPRVNEPPLPPPSGDPPGTVPSGEAPTTTPWPDYNFYKVYSYGTGNDIDRPAMVQEFDSGAREVQHSSTYRPSQIIVGEHNSITPVLVNEWGHQSVIRSIYPGGTLNYRNARMGNLFRNPLKFELPLIDDAPNRLNNLNLTINNFTNDYNQGYPGYVLVHHYESGNAPDPAVANYVFMIPHNVPTIAQSPDVQSIKQSDQYNGVDDIGEIKRFTYSDQPNRPQSLQPRPVKSIYYDTLDYGAGSLWSAFPEDFVITVYEVDIFVPDLYSYHPSSGFLGEQWAFTEDWNCPAGFNGRDPVEYRSSTINIKHTLIPVKFNDAGTDFDEASKTRIRQNDLWSPRNYAGAGPDLPTFTPEAIAEIKESGRLFMELVDTKIVSEMKSADPCGQSYVKSGLELNGDGDPIPAQWSRVQLKRERELLAIGSSGILNGIVTGSILTNFSAIIPTGQVTLTTLERNRVPPYSAVSECDAQENVYEYVPVEYRNEIVNYVEVLYPNGNPSGLAPSADTCLPSAPRSRYYTTTRMVSDGNPAGMDAVSGISQPSFIPRTISSTWTSMTAEPS